MKSFKMDNTSRDKTRILISGTYFSGSSAVVDLLNEYDGTERIPGEFDDFRRTGLVGDCLEYPVHVPYANRIQEYVSAHGKLLYVSRAFVGSGVKKKGKRAQLHHLLDKIIDGMRFGRAKGEEYLKEKRLNLLPRLVADLERAGSTAEKIARARDWLNEVELICAPSASYVVYDQPIFHGQHLSTWPEVFRPFKLIVVIRNPKDQIAQLIKTGSIYTDHSTCLTHGLHEIYGGGIDGMVKFNLDAMIGRLESIKKMMAELPVSDARVISFEGLVGNDSRVVPEIEKFVTEGRGDIVHANPRTLFDPSVSCLNVGIHEQYDYLIRNSDSLNRACQLYEELSNSKNEG